MENHCYDTLVSKTFSQYTRDEKQKLQVLANLLIEAGLLWNTYDKEELPVLVAGLAKHCSIKKVRKLSTELIETISLNTPLIDESHIDTNEDFSLIKT